MSLSHDDYDFEASHLRHGLVMAGPWQMGIEIGVFSGVVGESHLIDKRKGRDLSCRVMLFGHDTENELEGTMSAINAKSGELTGKLTMTRASGDVREWDDTTFIGFEMTREPFLDGKQGTTDKWCTSGFLRWRQRKGN